MCWTVGFCWTVLDVISFVVLFICLDLTFSVQQKWGVCAFVGRKINYPTNKITHSRLCISLTINIFTLIKSYMLDGWTVGQQKHIKLTQIEKRKKI